MKFLVIGLGSMGKRRIRNLQYLKAGEIVGFDPREDRRNEVEKRYKIKTFKALNEALEQNPDIFVISTPPDKHSEYALIAIKEKKHFFVEANVVDTHFQEIIEGLKKISIIGVPSATMLFHPAIKEILKIIRNNELGKISNIIYHSGQYLADWHIYEKVSDFYVSNPVTGGAREIVPFELTWLTYVFGFPYSVCGYNRKTINIEGAEKIDDTYNFLMDYQDFLASITVDVVSRHAIRRLLINGEKKQLIWNWEGNRIKVFNPISNDWEEIPYEMGKASEGYNPNIGENMYIDEMTNFIEAIEGKKKFINSMENDYRVLQLLYAIEESDKTSKYIRFEK